MEVHVSSLLSRLYALFFKIVPGPLQGIVKAIVAAIIPLVSVSLLNGSFDYKAIIAAVLSAIAVYIAPNKAKAAPAPVPPAK